MADVRIRGRCPEPTERRSVITTESADSSNETPARDSGIGAHSRYISRAMRELSRNSLRAG